MSERREAGGGTSFALEHLPFELQRHILLFAVEDREVSNTALLGTSSSIHDIIVPLLYTDVSLTSIGQVLSFIVKDAGPTKHAPKHVRTFTFTLNGVPGGSTRGGRDSAPSSPPSGGTVDDAERTRGNDRLLLASQAALLCPALQHMTIEMFGKRHSTLLTSSDYLAEEANAFRACLAQASDLRSFAWVTPRVNENFVGFSVAVVDLAFGPLIEGLLAAAVEMTPAGRRVTRAKGSLDRFSHRLQHVTLHHCIFPMSAYSNESLFHLFAQTHPDDEDWLLFPNLQTIVVRTAINVDPFYVALLALTWQLRLDVSMAEALNGVERHQLEACPGCDPQIYLSDPFVKSAWGPRLTSAMIRQHVVALIDGTDVHAANATPSSDNPLIRALEEEGAVPRLSASWKTRLARLTPSQRTALADAACRRVTVTVVADTIAGTQGGHS